MVGAVGATGNVETSYGSLVRRAGPANRSLRPNREENETESLGDRREGLASSAEIIIDKADKEKPAHTGMRPQILSMVG